MPMQNIWISGKADWSVIHTRFKMKQTPIYNQPNSDLLELIPKKSKRLVEVGSSSGALAEAFKRINRTCHYTGIEIDAERAELSRRHCDVVLIASIEDLSQASFNALLPVDCWIFGDTLEHLKDPWSLLKKIRDQASLQSSIVACIPNSQHWSLQVRLNCGEFRYEDTGLLDRTHLRFFTRTTMIEMFKSTGFRIVEGKARAFDEPAIEILEAVKAMAIAIRRRSGSSRQ